MKRFLLLCVLILTSCDCCGVWHTYTCGGKDPVNLRFEQPYEVFYRTEGFSPEYREVLQEAMAVWQVSSGGRIVWIEDTPPNPDAIHTLLFKATWERVKNFEKNTYAGLFDPDEQTIYVVGKVIPDSESLKVILEHEIGHYFGLDHVPNNVHSVMHTANGAMDDPGFMLPLHDRVEFYNHMCGYTDER